MYFVGKEFEPENGGYKTLLQATKQAEKKGLKVFDESGAQVYQESETAVEPQEEVEAVIAVEATDEVPDGALEENPDGSVNTYNADGEKIGTVSKEEMERLRAAAGELYERGAIGTVVVVRDGLLALRSNPNWGSGYKCGIVKTGYTARAVGRMKAPEGDFYKLESGKYISARPEDTKLVER